MKDARHIRHGDKDRSKKALRMVRSKAGQETATPRDNGFSGADEFQRKAAILQINSTHRANGPQATRSQSTIPAKSLAQYCRLTSRVQPQ